MQADLATAVLVQVEAKGKTGNLIFLDWCLRSMDSDVCIAEETTDV